MFNYFEKTDSKIQEDVISELEWEPSLTSSQITVSTKDGIVTLHGSVPHYYEKSIAESAAQRVGGVRAVADEIEVKLMGSYKISDEDIARAAANALDWNYSIPASITVAVDKGWITLSGTAEWEYQRDAAKNAVRQLLGVVGVSNNIIIEPTIQASDVKEYIQGALTRSAEMEGRNISVKIEGNQVTLSGNVHSYYEMNVAALAAWRAPGVKKVENKLVIAR